MGCTKSSRAPGRRRTWATVIAALALSVAATGCADYKAKEFTADNECIDCSDKGGLFSGDDGKFTYDF